MIIHHPFQYSIGWFQLTGFGLAVLFAFWIAQISSAHILEERGKDPNVTSDVLFGAVVGGLLGAKIYYAILRGDWHELFQRAGFVFWGGLIGGIIASWAVIIYKKWKFTTISDAAAPGIAAAYAIGRTGCWAVGDDYGRPWNAHFAVQFPEGAPPSTAINMVQEFHVKLPPNVGPMDVLSVYPTQLFEVTMGFIMFLILWRYRNHKHAEGWLFGFYCVLAGIERFIVEFFRAKDDRFFGPFTTAQLIALLFAAGGATWMYLRRTSAPLPTPPLDGPARRASTE